MRVALCWHKWMVLDLELLLFQRIESPQEASENGEPPSSDTRVFGFTVQEAEPT